MPVKLFSYAIVGAGVVVLLAWLLGILTDDVVLILGVVFVAGGLALAAYLAVQVFGQGKPLAFWIAPAVGAAVIGLVLMLGALADDDYLLFVGVGMTIANAAFLYDAWQRVRPAKA